MKRRRYLVAAAAVIVVATAATLGITAVRANTSAAGTTKGYCALLPDSIGLYVGNPVTQMGFPVGTVDKITSDATSVRVEFSLHGRALPEDVKATIRSASILADRSLEVVGNYTSGPELAPGHCIPLARTATPKSISAVVGSATTFVEGMTPSDSANVADAVAGLDRLTHDRGADLGALLTRSSLLAQNPDRVVADIGTIITDVAQLSSTIDANTGPLKQIITALPVTTHNVSDALWGTADLIDALPEIVSLVDDLERHLGTQTQQVLDVLPSAIHLAATRAGDIAAFLEPLPALIGLAADATRGRDGIAVTYRPPVTSVRTPDPNHLCAALNAALPGSCAPAEGQSTTTNVSLLQLVLAGGAR